MNNQLTEIAFVLDRSGSMQSQLEAAISGFNNFLHDQKETPGEARFTLVLFDDQYETPCNSIPISEVVELDTGTFVPRGTTALLDAVGRTIDELGAHLSSMPENGRPGQVIVAILTDGLENASQKYSCEDIAAKISHQRDVYQWEFLFLGANQDAIATASQMSIAAANAMQFTHDEHGVRSSQAAMNRKVRALRKFKSGAAMSVEESLDVSATLSRIGAEEDAKSRQEEER